MRARWGSVVGVAVVLSLAVAMVVVILGTDHHPRDDAPAAERLVRAWERSRTATFVTSGTFERRSEISGSTISSEDVVAQRPPRRIHRQLGGVQGRDDDRVLVCPAAPPDRPAPPCTWGAPGGRTYADEVEREVAGLRSLVTGRDPVYAVADAGAGCFRLEQLRTEPRAPFGVEASFCFDADTGAPVRTRVIYAGGIVETVVVTDVRAEVTDADLEP